ncbi:basic proline-rich protein-like [Tachyglossus aculeatus]|uniref:basic proline-rich protein-like n=1 Tax=Tachyglossus aculeatus TaxID=9261 RepID=UPI0018F7B12D|nr:basic proline-rich protein-like [Tachyglossus aculeatus]
MAGARARASASGPGPRGAVCACAGTPPPPFDGRPEEGARPHFRPRLPRASPSEGASARARGRPTPPRLIGSPTVQGASDPASRGDVCACAGSPPRTPVSPPASKRMTSPAPPRLIGWQPVRPAKKGARARALTSGPDSHVLLPAPHTARRGVCACAETPQPARPRADDYVPPLPRLIGSPSARPHFRPRLPRASPTGLLPRGRLRVRGDAPPRPQEDDHVPRRLIGSPAMEGARAHAPASDPASHTLLPPPPPPPEGASARAQSRPSRLQASPCDWQPELPAKEGARARPRTSGPASHALLQHHRPRGRLRVRGVSPPSRLQADDDSRPHLIDSSNGGRAGAGGGARTEPERPTARLIDNHLRPSLGAQSSGAKDDAGRFPGERLMAAAAAPPSNRIGLLSLFRCSGT